MPCVAPDKAPQPSHECGGAVASEIFATMISSFGLKPQGSKTTSMMALALHIFTIRAIIIRDLRSASTARTRQTGRDDDPILVHHNKLSSFPLSASRQGSAGRHNRIPQDRPKPSFMRMS
ncbi:hypothetical protein EJ06DRAFT_132869 [Trichodelitschia bisporula]|uniref:Uncharacterized protein n=1 Tax=Trichodelitschia bisporula TaxID=703511 RepID=A0A6G1HNQ4_9PEZI|nr:hypothetical protein EJ06DRAFT_132869 [Trichodelitschia bisporula]